MLAFEGVFVKGNMQLFAIDERGELTHASAASKKISYKCPTCHEAVRRKSGPTQQPHFFHCRKSACEHSYKSPEHLAVQQRIARELPEAIIECRFPQIGRIADICSKPLRLVIEVQCSSMTIKEARRRRADYESLGFTLVWVLHCHKYYQRVAHPFEYLLAKERHYFTNIDAQGEGVIFDVISRIEEGKRVILSEPLPISFLSWPPVDYFKARQKLEPSRSQRFLWHAKGFMLSLIRILLVHSCRERSRGGSGPRNAALE